MRIFLFFVTLLPIIALGNDIYLFYERFGVDTIAEDLQETAKEEGADSLFSSFGYVWTRYHPESYKATAQATLPEKWHYINDLLSLKIFFTTLGLAILSYILAFVLKFVGRKEKSSGHSAVDKILDRKKIGHMKYKRK